MQKSVCQYLDLCNYKCLYCILKAIHSLCENPSLLLYRAKWGEKDKRIWTKASKDFFRNEHFNTSSVQPKALLIN